jgi:hypothetical protein
VIDIRPLLEASSAIQQCGTPEPIRCAIGQPGPMMVPGESQAHTEHAGLVFPCWHQRTALGPFNRQASHNGKPIGMQPGGFKGQIIPVTLPCWWHHHHLDELCEGVSDLSGLALW